VNFPSLTTHFGITLYEQPHICAYVECIGKPPVENLEEAVKLLISFSPD